MLLATPALGVLDFVLFVDHLSGQRPSKSDLESNPPKWTGTKPHPLSRGVAMSRGARGGEPGHQRVRAALPSPGGGEGDRSGFVEGKREGTGEGFCEMRE